MDIIEEMVIEKMVPKLIERIKEFMSEELYTKDDKVGRLADICSMIIWGVLGPKTFSGLTESRRIVRSFCIEFASRIDDKLLEEDSRKQKDCN